MIRGNLSSGKQSILNGRRVQEIPFDRDLSGAALKRNPNMILMGSGWSERFTNQGKGSRFDHTNLRRCGDDASPDNGHLWLQGFHDATSTRSSTAPSRTLEPLGIAKATKGRIDGA
jgi:hypothetical protein